MYDSSLLILLSWPVIIIVSYFAIRIALYFYEKKQNGSGQDADRKLASNKPD